MRVVPIDIAQSVRFAQAARVLIHECRRQGLTAPGFRSPPRLDGVDRSLRRWPAGGAAIAVRIRSRPFVAVLADMVEGVVATNGLRGADADRCRHSLWKALNDAQVQAA